jgi:hypothetical protein
MIMATWLGICGCGILVELVVIYTGKKPLKISFTS